VANNEQWNIALYADAIDTTQVTVAGWVTDSAHYLKIYTPHLSTEVGRSQRHDGSWSNAGYRLSVVGGDSFFFSGSKTDARVEGLQIEAVNATAFNDALAYHDAGNAVFYATDNIVRFSGASGGVIPDLNVRVYPTIYVVDARGVIRDKDVRGKFLDQAVDALLKELEERSPRK
jgi:hypothetical protein